MDKDKECKIWVGGPRDILFLGRNRTIIDQVRGAIFRNKDVPCPDIVVAQPGSLENRELAEYGEQDSAMINIGAMLEQIKQQFARKSFHDNPGFCIVLTMKSECRHGITGRRILQKLFFLCKFRFIMRP